MMKGARCWRVILPWKQGVPQAPPGTRQLRPSGRYGVNGPLQSVRNSILQTPRCVSFLQARRNYSSAPDVNTSGSDLVLCTTEALPNNLGTKATVTINNPSKLNIVNSTVLTQLASTILSLHSVPNLRAVILTGAAPPNGKTSAFCGGADITEMAAINTPEEAKAFILRIHDVCQAIRTCPALVIARIDGLCLGGGLEIAVSCDFRFATINSSFAMPEVKVGIPSVVEARLLVNLVGWSMTRKMVYLGETYHAPAMYRSHLVDFLAKDAKRMDYLLGQIVRQLAERGPEAMREQKKLVRVWEEEEEYEDSIKAGVRVFSDTWKDGGKEPKEFMARFINRPRGGRKPGQGEKPGLVRKVEGTDKAPEEEKS